MSTQTASTDRRSVYSPSPRSHPIFNGEPGTHWTNDTGVIQYQFVASLINTCGACLRFHLAISRLWGIPLHYGCNCHQVAIKREATAPHAFCDYQKLLDEIPHAQQVKAIGGSVYRLLKEGVVTFDEIVTRNRVRTLQEIVARHKITIRQMTDAGVRPDIARRAYETVHTPEADLVEAERRRLFKTLEPGSAAQKELIEGLSKRLAGRVTLAPIPEPPPKPPPPAPAPFNPPSTPPASPPATVVSSGPTAPVTVQVASGERPGESIPPRPVTHVPRVEPSDLKHVLQGTKITSSSSGGKTTVKVSVPPAPKTVPATAPTEPIAAPRSERRPPYQTFATTADAEQWAENNYRAWAKKLTQGERNAIEDYRQDAWRPLNEGLRGPAGEKGLHPWLKKIAEKLDTALAKHPLPEATTVIRSIDLESAGYTREQLVPGKEITDKGYTSTSVDPNKNWAGQRLEIRLPKGTPAAYVNLVGEGNRAEKELLVSRHVEQFRIIGVKDDLYHTVILEAIWPPDKKQ